MLDRRSFLIAAAAAATASRNSTVTGAPRGAKMRYGLVTYMWGADWDLPTLLANCERARVLGVELRTTHKHGVERSLSAAQRKEVKKRFADSPVELVGIGSNERFDNPKPEVVRRAIAATKDFIRLSADVGGSGVKVKPDRFHKGVPREKTIRQIGAALNELGEFADDYNQQIRLEVHGQCAQPRTIQQIMQVAKHKRVAVCWNSNKQDLQDGGLEKNFQRLIGRFGKTMHVRELDDPNYPYKKLIQLLVAADYDGWVMIEASSKPKDRVAALARQAKLFKDMVAAAQ